jgi:hypothetical protein
VAEIVESKPLDSSTPASKKKGLFKGVFPEIRLSPGREKNKFLMPRF